MGRHEDGLAFERDGGHDGGRIVERGRQHLLGPDGSPSAHQTLPRSYDKVMLLLIK